MPSAGVVGDEGLVGITLLGKVCGQVLTEFRIDLADCFQISQIGGFHRGVHVPNRQGAQTTGDSTCTKEDGIGIGSRTARVAAR